MTRALGERTGPPGQCGEWRAARADRFPVGVPRLPGHGGLTGCGRRSTPTSTRAGTSTPTTPVRACRRKHSWPHMPSGPAAGASGTYTTCGSPPGTIPDPAFELHRVDLRRGPPPHQGHQPTARRDLLPDPGLGSPGPGLPGWCGLTMTADGLRLLQDIRRSVLDPPRQLRPRTVAVAPARRSPIL